MILAFDVGYHADHSKVAVGILDSWNDVINFDFEHHQLAQKYSLGDFKVATFSYEALPADYQPGAFYKRELPLIGSALKNYQLHQVDLIIVDGYVDLKVGKPGLGAYLYDELDQQIPVIGVAKSYFRDTDALPILRGESQKPLYVSARGISLERAAAIIANLPGKFRHPDFLKAVDLETRV